MKEYRLRLIETELDDNFKPIKTRSFENKYISTIPAADNLLLENLKKELFKKYYNEYFNTDKGFVKITNQNHSLSIAPNANAGQRTRIDELTKIVKEKDKEIEILKQELEEINAGYDFTYEQSSGAIKELKQNQTQFAIQELEKVKILIQNAINFVRPNFVEVYDAINKQIKELKGEKDEKL